MAPKRYSLEAGLKAGSGLTKAHADLVALPEYLAVTEQGSNSISPIHRGEAALGCYKSHHTSAKLDIITDFTPPMTVHQMVYEANVLVCHDITAPLPGNVWDGILAAKGPNRKHGRQQQNCLVAGKTRTKQGFGNSGLTQEMSLSPLPPLRHENNLDKTVKSDTI